jgi:methanogenic corrinoid protein MtbC1
MRDELFNKIVDMDEEGSIKLAKEYLDGGGDPQKLLEVCRDAMGAIGDKFEKGEYFLSELILGGEIFSKHNGIHPTPHKRRRNGKTRQNSLRHRKG